MWQYLILQCRANENCAIVTNLPINGCQHFINNWTELSSHLLKNTLPSSSGKGHIIANISWYIMGPLRKLLSWQHFVFFANTRFDLQRCCASGFEDCRYPLTCPLSVILCLCKMFILSNIHILGYFSWYGIVDFGLVLFCRFNYVVGSDKA